MNVNYLISLEHIKPLTSYVFPITFMSVKLPLSMQRNKIEWNIEKHMTKQNFEYKNVIFLFKNERMTCYVLEYMNEVKEKYFIEHTVGVKWRFIDKFCWNISDE